MVKKGKWPNLMNWNKLLQKCKEREINTKEGQKNQLFSYPLFKDKKALFSKNMSLKRLQSRNILKMSWEIWGSWWRLGWIQLDRISYWERSMVHNKVKEVLIKVNCLLKGGKDDEWWEDQEVDMALKTRQMGNRLKCWDLILLMNPRSEGILLISLYLRN